MKTIIKEQTKLQKMEIKTRILNFQIHLQKSVNKYLKNFRFSGSLNVNRQRKVKAFGSKISILHDPRNYI